MKKPLFMLVYTSRSINPIDEVLSQQILETSREHNLHDNITGFLAARTGYFLQLLEGPEENVRDCFKRICADPRHTQITLQGEAACEERMLPDWSMGWVKDQSISNTEDLLSLFEMGRQGKIFSDPRTLQTMLRMFTKTATIL